MLIATAGHVDHGKSTLINALTGQPTDRLREEKQRGLTIDLGYAHTRHDDVELSFVDVPGHEKFKRNMLAGVAQVDAVMLVVAADDGPMPQTHEHLTVIDLLGIEHGVVVITRCDLVDDDRLADVRQQVGALIAATSLADAPVLNVSAISSSGIDVLKQCLASLSKQMAASRPRGSARHHMRMTIDRAFTVAGSGRVVTGTVLAGDIAVGDDVHIAPLGRACRVRGIQHHGSDSERVHTGERAAVNLAGVGDAAVARGDWLVSDARFAKATRLAVQLRVPRRGLHDAMKPVAHWSPVQMHLATRRVSASLATEGGKVLQPGTTTYVQLVVSEPVHCVFGDRFVLRGGSGASTWLAGGHVVEPLPALTKAGQRQRWQLLPKIDSHSDDDALAVLLAEAVDGVDWDVFCGSRNLRRSHPDTVNAKTNLVEIKFPSGASVFISDERYEELQHRCLTFLGAWHRDRPQEVGPPAPALYREITDQCAPLLWRGLLDMFIRARIVSRTGSLLHLPEHRAQLAAEDEDAFAKISGYFLPDTLRPLALKDLCAEVDIERTALEGLLSRVAASGRLLRVAQNRYYHPQAILSLATVANQLEVDSGNQGFEAGAFRDATKIGRNLAIDVLEYFDRQRFTRRIKNTRRVIADPKSIFSAHV